MVSAWQKWSGMVREEAEVKPKKTVKFAKGAESEGKDS